MIGIEPVQLLSIHNLKKTLYIKAINQRCLLTMKANSMAWHTYNFSDPETTVYYIRNVSKTLSRSTISALVYFIVCKLKRPSLPMAHSRLKQVARGQLTIDYSDKPLLDAFYMNEPRGLVQIEPVYESSIARKQLN